ncbi:MAG: AMP-binding protein [Alphaproteobacteria bacterium]|nr:AMP-binding protein [Alphaproteobacteria bacterium]
MPRTLPDADVCVSRHVLERHAREKPDETFVVFETGGSWTYAETLNRIRKVAAALQSVSVGQDDHVVVWLPNNAESLETYLAINYIGGVYIPINTGYRGGLLAHVIENSDARVIIAHHDLAPRLDEIDTARLETVLLCGKTDARIRNLTIRDYHDIVDAAAEPSDPLRPIQPWDLQSIVYTSGTTGPSKGTMSSYFHAYNSMNHEAWYCLRDDDRALVNLPMFHIAGCFISYAMLCRGGSITLSPGFKTDTFWDVVRATKSTMVFLLGVMCSFLIKQEPRDDDQDHPLRMVFSVPLTEESVIFRDRFGTDLYTLFNMTEVNTPIISEANPREPGRAGKARPVNELRIVDEHDIEVPEGEVGELIIRPDLPWAINHGYYKNPEATVLAWRNGWFHTGDAFRQDAEGNYYFVDRLKDAIRRRGENISSFEVEVVVNDHPAVQECAAIPVPSEHGEDEVMVVLAAKPGQVVDPAELTDFLVSRMAHFMVPRYIRIMDELPKTPTTKIQKASLRKTGVTADTWDREASGIRLRGAKLA